MNTHARQSKRSETDVGALIASLAEELSVPEDIVGEIFRAQWARLSAEARIGDFLAVLALRNARTILRGTRQSN